MNTGMSEIKKLTEQERNNLKKDFTESMLLAKAIFNNWAFRKSDKYPEKRKPINKALFEVWSVSLSKLNEIQRQKLLERKNILFEKSLQLIKTDSIFLNSITTSTGNKGSVIYRFSSIEKIIKETIEV